MEPPPLQTARPTFNDALVSVVVPAFNEQDNLESLHARLAATLRACAPRHEIIFVDDGSRDRTLEVIRKLAAADPKVKYLSFSRNFGHEPATTAGMDHARGDAVVLIDADLQDPPEIIAQMVERWKAGAQVVYAQRRTRAGETVLKKATSAIFYRALDSISEVRIPRDTGDFRLMDRAVVEAVRRCRENPRFVRGLVAWAGFRQEPLLYDRDARFAGETKYNFRKLLRLSFEAVTSFSLLPLRWAMQLGAAVVGVAFLLLLTNVVLHIARGETLGRGFDYLACALIFLAGLQLLMLGVMAEYLGMIHRNTLARPLYLVAEQRGFDTPAP
ncbi:MAG: glycosyltransferase family 2 protein [Phycisphaeraceae bacterium]|nr:glycosyltransferase family 2 protein [Phycisphaeraceae bacterium]